jgi:flagellar protein FlgJ
VSAEGLRRALAGTKAGMQAGRGVFDAGGGTEVFPRQAAVRGQPVGPAQPVAAPQSAAAPQPAAVLQPAAVPQTAVAPQPAAADDGSPAAFVRRMWEPAIAAQQATGVPAEFIVGQAALESGWGRRELRHADGTPAHNLFGIKAGPGWRGATVESVTTEYVDGNPIRTVERFRAYGSHQESFADWARLMSDNPRYAGVLRGGGSIGTFAQGLQRAGYATDPNYAAKLSRTIGQALALSRDAA